MSTDSDTQPSRPDVIAMRREGDCVQAAKDCLQDLAPHLGAYTLSPAVLSIITKHMTRLWDVVRTRIEPADG